MTHSTDFTGDQREMPLDPPIANLSYDNQLYQRNEKSGMSKRDIVQGNG